MFFLLVSLLGTMMIIPKGAKAKGTKWWVKNILGANTYKVAIVLMVTWIVFRNNLLRVSPDGAQVKIVS